MYMNHNVCELQYSSNSLWINIKWLQKSPCSYATCTVYRKTVNSKSDTSCNLTNICCASSALSVPETRDRSLVETAVKLNNSTPPE